MVTKPAGVPMPNSTPLNPDALCKAAEALYNENPWQKEVWHNTFWVWEELEEENQDDFRRDAEVVIHAYLAVAQPVVNSVEELDGLPNGSLVRSGGREFYKASYIELPWILPYGVDRFGSGFLAKHSKVVLVHRPEVDDA